MTGRVVRAGASLAHAIEGTGPPVVLVHALGGDRAQWAWHVPVLARRFRVVSVDLRGHGASTAGDGPWTLDALAADLAAVGDATGAPRAAFVGASLGAEAVLRLALAAPGRVGALVLIGAAGGAWPPGARDRYGRLAERARREGLAGIADDLVALLLPPAARDGAAARRFRERLAAGANAAQAALAAALFEATPVLPGLRDLRIPALVLSGAEDPLVPPPLAGALAAALPGSTHDVLAGRGHLCAVEDPAGTATRIAAFLDRAWASADG